MELNDKKLAILAAAENVFSRRGIDAASVREISKEANINIAMISYYFGSKEKLVENLFSWRIAKFNAALEQISDNEILSPLEKLPVLQLDLTHKENSSLGSRKSYRALAEILFLIIVTPPIYIFRLCACVH